MPERATSRCSARAAASSTSSWSTRATFLAFATRTTPSSSPDATTQVITPLACSLFGEQMDVEIRPGTKAFDAYGRTRTAERYYCNFGLNPAYVEQLEQAGLVVSGVDDNGEVRILEHPTLRFFMGTLFVPQTSSAPGDPHPLVVALVEAAAVPVNASNEAIAQQSTR